MPFQPYAEPSSRVRAEREPLDLAFADTVVALDLDLDDPIPASGIVVSDPTGTSRRLTPVVSVYSLAPPPPAFPLAQEHEPVEPQKLRSFWSRIRHGLKASRAEMTLLWSATASLEEAHDGRGTVVYDEDPFVRAATVGRRVRTLFSFFEWDRSDLLRAAWIGLAVFALVATVGAVVLERGAAASPGGVTDTSALSR